MLKCFQMQMLLEVVVLAVVFLCHALPADAQDSRPGKLSRVRVYMFAM